MTRHKKTKFKLKSIYLWHRYLGLSAALFVVLLSVTGLLLNHTDDLSLTKKQITSEWILNWYGIEPPEITAAHRSGQNYVSQWDAELYLNQTHIGHYENLLLGMVTLDDIIVIAVTGKVLLVTTAGEIIEVLDHNQGLPAGIKKIGINVAGDIIVDAAHGYYRADSDLINWHHHDDGTNTKWSTPTILNNNIDRAIRQNIHHHSVHYERFILDLHSGRFFGSWGIYLMDAAAIILLLLSITGGSLWLIRIIKQKKHHKQIHTH